VIAQGTPEQVALVEDSYTGQFLAPVLARGAGVLGSPAGFIPTKAGADKPAAVEPALKRATARKPAASRAAPKTAATKKAATKKAATKKAATKKAVSRGVTRTPKPED